MKVFLPQDLLRPLLTPDLSSGQKLPLVKGTSLEGRGSEEMVRLTVLGVVFSIFLTVSPS